MGFHRADTSGIGALRLAAAMLAPGCGDGTTSSPTTPAPAPPPAPPDPPDPLRLEWPVSGEPIKDWLITNYVDLDPSAGLRDYRGGEITYDERRGTDVGPANFRWMDRDSPLVLAAAPGRVSKLNDGEFDRQAYEGVDSYPRGGSAWNFVELTHADGSRTICGHLKRGSVAVAIGQELSAGEARDRRQFRMLDGPASPSGGVEPGQ